MIETNRLQLVPCELHHFTALLTDAQRLEPMLDVKAPKEWLVNDWEDLPHSLEFSYKYLKEHPEALGWWTYMIITRVKHILIGQGGFKGAPDDTGSVEIGYEIIPTYRGQGLATEAARGFVDYAFSHPQVQQVKADTSAEQNASTRVLQKIGMRYMGMRHDPKEGNVWHWSLRREDYRSHKALPPVRQALFEKAPAKLVMKGKK